MKRAENIIEQRTSPFFSLPLRLAATILLFVGAGIWLVSTWPGESSQYRTSDQSSPLRLLSPGDNEMVTSPPRLRWSAVEGATYYQITVYKNDGTVIFRERVPGVELSLSPSVVFEAGNLYLWNIQALFPDGSSVSSELHTFKYASR
ncbi:MAG TPA: hypothetical protein VNN76_03440 [Bacteroidota bacterium]|nr:hypothetical protein [Bacteroidota bacterium]